MKTISIQTSSKIQYVWVALLLALIAGAAYAWSIQFTEGLGVTGLSNITPWGLYVQFFNFLVGVGGGVVMVSAAMHLANIRSFRPLLRISIALGAVAAVLGSILIMCDLGRPERAIYFFSSPNLGSSMVWDMIFMVTFLVVVVGYGWFSMRADLARRRSPLALGVNDLSEPALNRDKSVSRIFAGAALIAAALLANQASLTSWTLTEHEALKAVLTRMLLAPLFLVLALSSGVAGLLFVVLTVSKFTDLKSASETVGATAKLLAGLLLVSLAVILTEATLISFRGQTLLWVMTSGPYAQVFWMAITIGAVVPLALLVYPKTRRTGSSLAIASLLSLAGVFLIRFDLQMQGTLYPRIAYPPGIPLQMLPQTVWTTIGTYTPTTVEAGVITGVLAFGALLFTLVMKVLPLKQEVSKPIA